jgi:hypothetical protein
MFVMLLVGSGCSIRDHWGNPPDPPDASPPSCDPVPTITIDSFPTTNPVVTDVEVIGTISGDPAAVTKIFLGAREAARDVTATPGAIWKAVVPLTLLLEPNRGPGTVSIYALAITTCKAADSGGIEAKVASRPFVVDFAPIPSDAGGDAGP